MLFLNRIYKVNKGIRGHCRRLQSEVDLDRQSRVGCGYICSGTRCQRQSDSIDLWLCNGGIFNTIVANPLKRSSWGAGKVTQNSHEYWSSEGMQGAASGRWAAGRGLITLIRTWNADTKTKERKEHKEIQISSEDTRYANSTSDVSHTRWMKTGYAID